MQTMSTSTPPFPVYAKQRKDKMIESLYLKNIKPSLGAGKNPKHYSKVGMNGGI